MDIKVKEAKSGCVLANNVMDPEMTEKLELVIWQMLKTKLPENAWGVSIDLQVIVKTWKEIVDPVEEPKEDAGKPKEKPAKK